MTCPNCKYAHGFAWVEENHTHIDGDCGGFYRSPIDVARSDPSNYHTGETREKVMACPKCGVLFIDVE